MKNWKDYTLGEISDEIDQMEKTSVVKGLGILPKSDYVTAKNALHTLKNLGGWK